MPPARASSVGFGLYLGCVAATAGAAVDYHLDLRPWKTVVHNVSPRSHPEDGFELQLRSKRRPPPIGCVDWPGGRVLLQWAIDEARLHEMPPESAHHPSSSSSGDISSSNHRNAQNPNAVLEMGAGIGTASIGIAAAAKAIREASHSSRKVCHPEEPLRVVATDVCEQTLANLEGNAALNGVDVHATAWDACKGEASVRELPLPLHSIRHIIGSDVVYNGFETPSNGRQEKSIQRPATGTAAAAAAAADGDDDEGDEGDAEVVPDSGLEATLAALLRRRPDLPVTLLLEDRFSGGGVSALAGAAGVTTVQPATTDPAITRFKHNCRLLGLRVEKVPVPAAVVRRVHDSQGWLTRLSWWLCGTWEGGLALYRVSLEDQYQAAAERRSSSK